MATNRILMGSTSELSQVMMGTLSKLDGQPKLVAVEDGARLVNALTRLLLARQPPALVVLDLTLPRVGGQSAALIIRALEKSIGEKKIPVLLYGPDSGNDELKAFCKALGSTVHLRSRADHGLADQAKRLTQAIDRIVSRNKRSQS